MKFISTARRGVALVAAATAGTLLFTGCSAGSLGQSGEEGEAGARGKPGLPQQPHDRAEPGEGGLDEMQAHQPGQPEPADVVKGSEQGAAEHHQADHQQD